MNLDCQPVTINFVFVSSKRIVPQKWKRHYAKIVFFGFLRPISGDFPYLSILYKIFTKLS